MSTPASLHSLEGMDIYLIDQILKGRYQKGDMILDAGAGGGRNLNWFFQESFQITACDREAERQNLIKERNPGAHFTWLTCDLADMPIPDASFDHLICNAVLHFAEDEAHFEHMISELVRVLKTGGSLFIRTCGIMGLEDKVKPLGKGRFLQPDGESRFLLTPMLWQNLLRRHGLHALEPLKSVNVEDQRVMCTLVLVKYGAR